MQRVWSGLTPRLLAILESRDAVYGMLFVSRDNSGYVAARKLAEHIGDHVIVYAEENETAWRDKIAFLLKRDKYVRTPLIDDGPNYVTLVVDDLDTKPPWMWDYLKAVFEQRIRPCRICATAKNPRKIPGYLSSHLIKTSKIGRPKKK